MEKRYIRLAVKCAVFISITLVMALFVNDLMRPKYYYNSYTASTNTYADFYSLKDNSVDVLFMGSSHAMYSFNPQVIYDNYGITSYNLGSEEQSILITYYWLKEALKTQSPKIVVLDTYTFHKYVSNYVYNNLNCSEASIRKAMDDMRFSPLKVEAAKAIETEDSSQNWLSFFLLNLRYHSRWMNLSKDDYIKNSMLSYGGTKGYIVSGLAFEGAHDEVFELTDIDSVEGEPFVEITNEYLDKIVELCNQNEIQLILVNIPMSEPIERYKTTKEYADENNIPFFDFNEKTLYNSIDYSAARDKTSHPNYRGAEKISMYLGRVLAEKYKIQSKNDDSFDKSRQIYEHKIHNILLTETQNIYGYLDELDYDPYCIFVFAPVNYSEYYDKDMREKFNKLGFPIDLSESKVGVHYVGVKEGDAVIEEYTADNIYLSGIVGDDVIYKIEMDTSIVDTNCHVYSLIIDGEQCGNRLPGIDIVVYDKDMQMIIDRINVDTTNEEIPLVHY